MNFRRYFSLSSRNLVNWNESEILIDKKSKFQGRCVKLTSPNDVPNLIKELVSSNKTLSKASHPAMYAWRIGKLTSITSKNEPKFEFINQSSHDNGEGGSGSRLLGILERLKIINVLVVVSRWYGGTALGPARFRDISTVAIESLKIGGFLDSKGRPVYDELPGTKKKRK